MGAGKSTAKSVAVKVAQPAIKQVTPAPLPTKLPYSIDRLLLNLDLPHKENALPTSKELTSAYQRFVRVNGQAHKVSSQDTLGKLNSVLVSNSGNKMHEVTVQYQRVLADIEKLERQAEGIN
jgi:hypothetical protein